MSLTISLQPSSDQSCSELADFTLDTLIAQVSDAAEIVSVEDRVSRVREVLSDAIQNHPGFLPTEFCQPAANCYARRAVYADPEGRFSILAMCWSKGQGTPLHDHDGMWVVECVYSGLMKVQDYELLGESNDIYQFQPARAKLDGPGEAGFRIPPYEHHVLENAQDTPSVTIHVFGGLMERCDIFEPTEGGYRKTSKTLQLSA